MWYQMSVTLIDVFVLAGVAVVLPLALGGPVLGWPVAAASIGASFLLARGIPAAALVMPLAVMAMSRGLTTIRRAGPLFFWTRRDVVHVLASGWALVASGSLIVSRLGWTPLGQHEPIVELAGVHYIYAGVAALVLAGWTRRLLPILLTAAAPPIVAVGFVSGAAAPQVGGAVLMALGVWTTATLEVRAALDVARPRGERVLLAISGLAIWAPMVLAIAWAAGQHWNIPVLSIPAMARTHGAANATGFVLCGLLAHRRAARDRELRDRLERAASADVTYEPVTRTITEDGLVHHTRTLGVGSTVFDDAVRRLKAWAPQRHLGATVLPENQGPEVGATILVDLHLGPIAVAVPNRVVAVIDEPNRWGYAYGTLPGHHERGEESFIIRRHPDDTITASITVDAIPASLPARLLAPVVRALQHAAVHRYLEALGS
jgi:uncharacterized protein (UPF0548 family)